MKLHSTLYKSIFNMKTAIGRKIDSIIMVFVVLSIAVVMLESVETIRLKIGAELVVLEWFFTLFFTLEYILRIRSAPQKRKYIFSFLGVVDLLAILPTYVILLLTGVGSPLIIRSIRLVRVFRVFKLVWFLREGDLLLRALRASWRKVVIFLATSTTFAVIAGTLMFLIEGKENGFSNIPHSIYWAIVTLTTVGYGDISPSTPMGQAVASIIMILGYGIIAVPTGLVAAEMVYAKRRNIERKCPRCGMNDHEEVAKFCHACGSDLPLLHNTEKAP